MSESRLSDPAPLQFETAEYADKQEIENCSCCDQQIVDSYYRLNERMTCPACAELAKANHLNTDGRFLRALIFGTSAAILGLVLYSAFAIVTGWVIGYLSLAVGYIIAKAMLKGSGGVGGRRFQIAALVLTYSAVSLAAIPVAIHHYSEEGSAETSQTPNQTQTQAIGESESSGNQADTSGQSGTGGAKSLFAVFLTLLMLGLASPFLELSEGVNGVIGLVILFVGLNIAWTMTKGVQFQIFGPFSLEKQTSQSSMSE